MPYTLRWAQVIRQKKAKQAFYSSLSYQETENSDTALMLNLHQSFVCLYRSLVNTIIIHWPDANRTQSQVSFSLWLTCVELLYISSYKQTWKIIWQYFCHQQDWREGHRFSPGFGFHCLLLHFFFFFSPSRLTKEMQRLILTKIISGCSNISSESVRWCPELKRNITGGNHKSYREMCPGLLLTRAK